MPFVKISGTAVQHLVGSVCSVTRYGLKSIGFAVIVLDANVPNGGTLAMVVACTGILSIMGHGVTTIPWAKPFGVRSRQASGS